jgi:hypothetical protein
MNSSFRNLFFCSLIGIGLFSLLNALPSSVRTQADLSIHIPRSEEWLRNQIGYVVGEKSTPSGERLGLSKNPPSPNQESGPPKAESRASESPTAGLKAAESVAPQTENLQPKTATDPDLWNFGIGHSPLVPLSPLRPIFTEILLTSLAVEEEGAELVGMTVQMDLPELGLTGEAILTDIRSAPAIEPPVGHLDTRQVVTATFHHSSGDVIDLVLADSRSSLPGRTFAAGEPQCRAVVPTAQPRNQGVNDWDNRSTKVAASREVLSGREDQQEAASDSPLSAFGSPLSPACEVGHSNHEPAESEETIGTTSNHPFWSVDRQEFVQAGSLEIGERLQTLSGDVKVVQQKLPRPGPQPVFNLEVHNEHVYFVGHDGVLVHNAKGYDTNLMGSIGEHAAIDAMAERGWNHVGTLSRGRNGIDLVMQKTIRGNLKTIIVESKVNGSRLSKLQRNGADLYAKGGLDRFAGSNLSGTSTANYAELQRMVLDKETIRGVIVRTDWRSGVVEQSISLWRKK